MKLTFKEFRLPGYELRETESELRKSRARVGTPELEGFLTFGRSCKSIGM